MLHLAAAALLFCSALQEKAKAADDADETVAAKKGNLTPVYELESLKPGHAFAGPAIVQAAYTTAVIPPGRRFSIESHGLGILEA